MPADEYIDYYHREQRKMIEKLRKYGFEGDGSQSDGGNDETLSVFRIGSENFNLNASLKPDYTFVYLLVAMIILTICIVIVILKKIY